MSEIRPESPSYPHLPGHFGMLHGKPPKLELRQRPVVDSQLHRQRMLNDLPIYFGIFAELGRDVPNSFDVQRAPSNNVRSCRFAANGTHNCSRIINYPPASLCYGNFCEYGEPLVRPSNEQNKHVGEGQCLDSMEWAPIHRTDNPADVFPEHPTKIPVHLIPDDFALSDIDH